MRLYQIAQSAYKENHSTETALLKVKNDILLNMNKQHVTLLVLLDLSAAFDTGDHDILLTAFNKRKLGGRALEWFRSYLSGRCQRISVRRCQSESFNLNCGVPHGSCLEPLLFTIYTSSSIATQITSNFTSLLALQMKGVTQMLLLSLSFVLRVD